MSSGKTSARGAAASDARAGGAAKKNETAGRGRVRPESAGPATGAEDEKPPEAASGEPDAGKDAADEELNAKYMRLAADFQNYRRRAEKEKSDIYAYANERILTDLLDVADNFERALEHGDGEDEFSKGMRLIFRQLADVLSKNEAEEIESLGETFDPNLHHAVMMEDTDAYESGRVTEVLKKGWRLRDKVIRPAMVKVAQ